MLHQIKSKTKQLGIGLLELMLSLAVISILLVMVTKYYQEVRFKQQVNEAIAQIDVIIAAGYSWIQGEDDFTGIDIDKIKATGDIPKNGDKNPWRGSVEVGTAAGGDHFTITMNDISAEACNSIRSKLKSHVNDIAKCTVTTGEGKDKTTKGTGKIVITA